MQLKFITSRKNGHCKHGKLQIIHAERCICPIDRCTDLMDATNIRITKFDLSTRAHATTIAA